MLPLSLDILLFQRYFTKDNKSSETQDAKLIVGVNWISLKLQKLLCWIAEEIKV